MTHCSELQGTSHAHTSSFSCQISPLPIDCGWFQRTCLHGKEMLTLDAKKPWEHLGLSKKYTDPFSLFKIHGDLNSISEQVWICFGNTWKDDG